MSTIFEGCYLSFDEITDADQYNNLNIIQRVYRYSLSRYETTHFFPDAIDNEYNHIRDISALLIALLCAETNNTLNILDIGGGFGASCIELMKRCQLQNFAYTICEINAFVQYYQTHPFFNENNISIIESLEQAARPYHLLIFGSALQYFSNTADTLQHTIQLAQFPKYILITHTPITQLPTFATAQVNMDHKRIPNWIFNIDSLINTFTENGYICIFKSAIFREALFSDFKGDEENYRSANLIFKKS